MIVIAVLAILGVVGLVTIGLLFARVKELHDWGYSWGYGFLQVFGGF